MKGAPFSKIQSYGNRSAFRDSRNQSEGLLSCSFAKVLDRIVLADVEQSLPTNSARVFLMRYRRTISRRQLFTARRRNEEIVERRLETNLTECIILHELELPTWLHRLSRQG